MVDWIPLCLIGAAMRSGGRTEKKFKKKCVGGGEDRGK